MKHFIKTLSFVAFLISAIFWMNCGNDSSATGPSGSKATVVGKLTLPAAANGKQYIVIIDNDINGDNGFLYSTSGNLGAGTSVSYSISDVDAGSYYIWAVVFVVGPGIGNPPVSGDYIGVFGGTLSNQPVAPNAVVPSSGSVTFDIALVVF